MFNEVRIRKVEDEYFLETYADGERIGPPCPPMNLVAVTMCLSRWFDDDPYGFHGPSPGTVADEIVAKVKDLEVDGESPHYYGALHAVLGEIDALAKEWWPGDGRDLANRHRLPADVVKALEKYKAGKGHSGPGHELAADAIDLADTVKRWWGN